MNINYKDTPFPYFYGSLDKKMYDYAHKLWSTDEDSKSYNQSKNRSNIDITDKNLINYLTKVGAEVKALSENFGIFEKLENVFNHLKQAATVKIPKIPANQSNKGLINPLAFP